MRKLVKLDSVKQLLHNHQEFPFLRIQDSFEKSTSKRLKVVIENLLFAKTPQNRTSFYSALGRLLMVDLGEDEEAFAKFMTPLSTAFNHLKSELADGKINGQTSHSVRN